MDFSWETEITDLLSQLSGTQEQLLALLDRKREALVKRDHQGLQQLAGDEQLLCQQLQDCQQRRQQLLAKAEEQGLPSDSIRSLAQALPTESGANLAKPLEQSQEQARLVRHQSVAQWVAVQRTLLHLSQMLEIIATGGRGQTTYGKGGVSVSSGALMDQAV